MLISMVLTLLALCLVLCQVSAIEVFQGGGELLEDLREQSSRENDLLMQYAPDGLLPGYELVGARVDVEASQYAMKIP